MRHILLSFSFVALLIACGQVERADEAASDGPVAAEASIAEEVSGRDLSAVDVCALIPAEVVAEASGATVEGPATASNPGFDGKGCTYELRAGGLRNRSEVSLHPPETCSLWRDIQSFKLEDLPGLGDRAFWGKRTGQTDLYVLKSGDVCMHVVAAGQELPQAEAIAKAVLERL